MASIGGGGTSNVEPGGSVGGVCRVKLFSPARILPATNAIAVARNKAEANAPNCRAPSEFFISEPRGSANGKTRNADRAAKRTPTSRGCVSSHRLSPASSLNRGDAPPAPASSATLKCSAENRLRAPKLTRVSPAAREAANGVNLTKVRGTESARNRLRFAKLHSPVPRENDARPKIPLQIQNAASGRPAPPPQFNPIGRRGCALKLAAMETGNGYWRYAYTTDRLVDRGRAHSGHAQFAKLHRRDLPDHIRHSWAGTYSLKRTDRRPQGNKASQLGFNSL